MVLSDAHYVIHRFMVIKIKNLGYSFITVNGRWLPFHTLHTVTFYPRLLLDFESNMIRSRCLWSSFGNKEESAVRLTGQLRTPLMQISMLQLHRKYTCWTLVLQRKIPSVFKPIF